LDTTVLGQQIFGGHGFIREWGQEQLVRDVRITQIYEGANGIQAMDLLGRKVCANGGQFFELFAADVQTFIDANAGSEAMAEFLGPLAEEMANLKSITYEVIEQAKTDPNAIGAAANDYLHLFGLTALAYMWAMMAKVALDKQDGGEADFYQAKLKVARFYFQRELPATRALSVGICAGSDTLMDLDEALF
jgi:3-(methylsulfanyl)propanoyl-CoA dehydrogenase